MLMAQKIYFRIVVLFLFIDFEFLHATICQFLLKTYGFYKIEKLACNAVSNLC